MLTTFLTRDVCDCLIVFPEAPTTVERTAAEELQAYLGKALGVTYPIVSEKVANGKCIYVGQTKYAEEAGILGKDTENWIMAMHGGSLILTGGKNKGDRGIIYAVYHFLEDIVGVRWWNPYEEDVLALEKLSFDNDLYKAGTPCFDYRKPFMDSRAGSQAFPYLAKTRTNAISPLDDDIADGVYDETVRRFGGARTAGRPHHVHTMGKYFPADKYFDEHPEWWAWNKVQGKHLKTGSYCLANEGFFNALLEKLLATIKEDMELAEKTGVELPSFYSISIDDVNEWYFCQCDECSKTIKESGYSGYVIKFVNKIARAVAEKYPFAKLEILAYLNFAEPPKDDTLPEKNCIIRFAGYFRDILRGIHSPSNERLVRFLKKWSEVCKKAECGFYIYDYFYSYQTNYPLPLFYSLKTTIEAYREYGVKGLFIEAQNPLADVFDINRYMLTHLLEYPDADENALLDDFLSRYYGSAAKYVKEYLELLRDTAERNKVQAWCYREDSRFNYIDAPAVIRGSELLDKAKEAVLSQEPFEQRVNWLRKPLDAVLSFKFFDLKKQAEELGLKFDFDIKTLKARVVSALEEFAKTPTGKRSLGAINQEIKYFKEIPEEEMLFDIPKELKDVDEKDIFQFSLVHIPKYCSQSIVKYMGYSVEEDTDTTVSKVAKFSNDTATGANIIYSRTPTSKYAENKNALTFLLQNEGGETVVQTDFYKEELTPGEYRLYYLGSFSGIADSYDRRLLLAGLTGFIGISGIAAVSFPMDACDIYISMKFSGETFGGNPEDENAMYIDRIVIVRKR